MPATDEDIEIMKLRRARPNAPLNQVLFDVVMLLGQDPTKVNMMEFLSNLIKVDKSSGLLDLNFHSQYEPTLGFRFNIEAIHNNKTKGFFAVLTSVMPNATYYDENRKKYPKDAFSCYKPDY